MTNAIKALIRDSGLLLCPTCKGEGEVGYFCGHETTETCRMCEGAGIVKSLKKQRHRNTCTICGGKGGPGCCGNKGYHEWVSYQLVTSLDIEKKNAASSHTGSSTKH